MSKGKVDLFCYQTELSKDSLRTLRKMEKAAYKGTKFAQMQDCESWSDVAEYCECKKKNIRVYMSGNWYILIAVHPKQNYFELVDVASTNNEISMFYSLLDYMKREHLLMYLNAREKTSYGVIKKMESAGQIQILKDKKHKWSKEKFHNMIVAVR